FPDCLDVSDEGFCEYHTFQRACTDQEFRCSNGQCIDQSQVCFMDKDSRRLGCIDNSHLVNCSDHQCPSEDMYKCPKSYCINNSRVCDGFPDCRQSLEDEDSCEFKCGENDVCTCRDGTMNCEDQGLTDIPKINVKQHTTKLLLKDNRIRLRAERMKAEDLYHVTYLDLTNNSLVEIPAGCFNTTVTLTSLSLSYNKLWYLDNGTFPVPIGLKQLHLTGNMIQYIEPGTFENLNDLTALDLSNQELSVVYKNMFKGLKSITVLNLAGNHIN
ncbi:hypothetical protein EGW08_015724, partial [Elysia chlorotica]